ncbi:MAG: hypothetical protein Kow0037_05240 [Calditrichia bacterium]
MNTFKPAPSLAGWISGISLVCILMASSLLVWPLAGQNIFLFLLSFLPLLVFLLVCLFFLIIFPTMRYILGEASLILKCGPFHWEIPYREIEEIEKANLAYHPSSTGWKLPGYTLFKVYFADRGEIRMCSTRMTKDILLIKTGNGDVFGITPENETEFVRKLQEKLQ